MKLRLVESRVTQCRSPRRRHFPLEFPTSCQGRYQRIFMLGNSAPSPNAKVHNSFTMRGTVKRCKEHAKFTVISFQVPPPRIRHPVAVHNSYACPVSRVKLNHRIPLTSRVIHRRKEPPVKVKILNLLAASDEYTRHDETPFPCAITSVLFILRKS